MKLTIVSRLAVIALAATLAAGCSLFQKPEEKKEEPKGGGQPAGGGAPAYDPRDSMMVFTPQTGWPKDGAGVKEGLFVSSKTVMTGAAKSETTQKWSVVGATADGFKVEVAGSAGQGYIQGLTIAKADGKVTKAVAGKKGEKLKDLKIQEMPKGSGEAPAGTDDKVTVKAGEFAAKKYVNTVQGQAYTTWSGTDGDAKGLLVKSAGPNAEYELVELKTETVKAGGKDLQARHAKYSNGSEQWYVTLEAPLPFVSAQAGPVMVKSVMTTGGNTITTEYDWGEGAKAELDWPK